MYAEAGERVLLALAIIAAFGGGYFLSAMLQDLDDRRPPWGR